LRVGWCRSEAVWTFPERDAGGRVVGILRRYPNGDKLQMAGGKRGLHLPVGWRDRAGPVFVVEGPSDVLTLHRLGLAVVGRPSNSGGAELLATLFKDLPTDRPIVVVAENDPKDTGEWPGLKGAHSISNKLTADLGREVKWVLPQGGAKDMREWVLRQGPDW